MLCSVLTGSVGCHIDSGSVSQVLTKLSLENSPIGEAVRTNSVTLVVLVLPIVYGAVVVMIDALAVHFALLVSFAFVTFLNEGHVRIQLSYQSLDHWLIGSK